MATPWPIEDASLSDLDLDLRNVRIPSSDLDQSAIAKYLVEAADLLGLARDILRDGYLDNELPVVTVEKGRYVVLEGNRRITALKAIHDPSLLGKSAPRIERLISRYPDAETPRQVRIMISPSREAAQPLLARLHTGQPKKSWIREQQAVFYHAQLGPTMTVEDLRNLYPESSIERFIRMGEMREVIRGLVFDDPILEQFVKANQLKMTSFEYAYARPKIQEALGLVFNKDGLLPTRKLAAGEQRGLIYLLERFQAGTLNTRSAELRANSVEHDALVEHLKRVVSGVPEATPKSPVGGGGVSGGVPSPGNPGPTNGAGGNGTPTPAGRGTPPPGAGGDPDGGTGSGTRGPNRGETLSRLNMDGFEYGGSSAGLRRRLEELRRIDLRDFPNAAHDLLRTVLECAIKDHFAAAGRPLAGKTMLSGCVEELARSFQQDQRMTALINAINRKGRLSATQYAGTANSLNASNHEPDLFVNGQEVHEAWEKIKPMLVTIIGK